MGNSCNSWENSFLAAYGLPIVAEIQAITPTERLLVCAPSDVSAHRGCFDLALKRYNEGVRIRFLIVFLALLTAVSLAQDSSDKTASDKASSDKTASDQAADRNREAEESSSHDTRIDISPPKDDAKAHPYSKAA